mmetsp:Transcript_34960/g.96663  ORF Transcript_34960/g.96663 Transcript_34960/m.96663 type:complete len:181 (+) Transcript_34960:75-617(+)
MSAFLGSNQAGGTIGGGAEDRQLRSKGLLPAIGVGGVVYLVSGVVSMGSLAMIGVGLGVGYGVGGWLGEQLEKRKQTERGSVEATRTSSSGVEANLVPHNMQGALMQWQAFLNSRAAGQQLTPDQLQSVFAEFAQLEPELAQHVMTIQAAVKSQRGAPASGAMGTTPVVQVHGGASAAEV